LLAQRGRLVVLALLNAHFGERNPWLCKRRVLASRAFQDQRRLLEPPCGAQIVPEHNGVLRCELSFLVEGAQVRDREVVASRGGVGDCPGAAGHEQTWIIGKYGGQLPNRKLRLGARRRHAAIEAWQHTDAVLWVALRSSGVTGDAGSAHIPERAQPLGRLCVNRRRRGWRGCTEQRLIELALQLVRTRVLLLDPILRF
jgi:hypothetical protein